MNMPDSDIIEFVKLVGATEPTAYRHLFPRHNYFRIRNHFLIVKISRTERPFWGIGKKVVDLANMLDSYFLVLLDSKESGWVFSKSEVNINVGRTWKLREADDNYKINPPMPDQNAFTGKAIFYQKLGINEP
jgi:hypothetical protein